MEKMVNYAWKSEACKNSVYILTFQLVRVLCFFDKILETPLITLDTNEPCL